MNLIQRQPLRVKLVALVLLLLTLAIVLIGVASNIAIGRYLTDKVDADLRTAARWQQDHPTNPGTPSENLVIPSDYIVAWPLQSREWLAMRYGGLSADHVPVLPDPDDVQPGTGP